MLPLFNPRVSTYALLCLVVVYMYRTSLYNAIAFRHQKPRYAFVTFLGEFTSPGDPSRSSRLENEALSQAPQSQEPDGYYLGVRYLNYMLRYNRDTRSPQEIPLLVLVTEGVEEYKIKQLRLEGAQVVQTDRVSPPSWLKPGDVRYSDVLTKLKLWRLTRYDKICFIDADTLLVDSLNGVFDDPATDAQSVNQHAEVGLPSSYVFAAISENYHFDHPIPPVNASNYLNSGFFVIAPDEQLYQYYMSKLSGTNVPDWGVGIFPEQDLLNSVHGWEGAAPWRQLDWRWNAHYPTYKDLQAGVKSLHDKFWEDEQSDPDFRSDPMLRTIWRDQVMEMERFYRARAYVNA